MFKNIYKDILKKIKEYDCIVCARHIGPDPDAIAAQIALKDIILKNFPKKKVYAVGTGVSKFKFLGSLDKIDNVDTTNALLIILDVPRFDRVDGALKENFKYTIKIDHHPCEKGICDLELVDETAASTTQMLTEFVFRNNLKIDKVIASKLYAGIVADSDRFLLSYTTPKTLTLSARLINDYGVDMMWVYNNLYERPISERKFESFIIENLTLTENGFGYIKINDEDIKKYGVDSSTASNMINDLNFIKELKVWAFSSYSEKEEIFKINIRSRNITINEIASRFNGGGHKFASGARIKNESEVDELFKALDNACKESEEDK